MGELPNNQFQYKQIVLPDRLGQYGHRCTGQFDYQYVDRLLKEKRVDLMFLCWGRAEAISMDTIKLMPPLQSNTATVETVPLGHHKFIGRSKLDIRINWF